MFQALQNVHKPLQILVKHAASKTVKKAYNTKELTNTDLNYQT